MKNSVMWGGALLVAAGALATAEASVWTADLTADVGRMLDTSSVTDGAGTLSTIRGQLVATFSGGAASWDQDIYRIRIVDGAAFSAVAYPTPGSPSGRCDLNLSLFDLDGRGVAFNDNANGTIYPALTNTFTIGLPAGDYYLAVSRNTQGGSALIQRFNRPIVAGGALMFPGQTNNTPIGDPTASLREGEYSNMSAVFAGWESNGISFPFNDVYTVDLTGVGYSVPAPGVAALLGLASLGAARRRR